MMKKVMAALLILLPCFVRAATVQIEPADVMAYLPANSPAAATLREAEANIREQGELFAAEYPTASAYYYARSEVTYADENIISLIWDENALPDGEVVHRRLVQTVDVRTGEEVALHEYLGLDVETVGTVLTALFEEAFARYGYTYSPAAAEQLFSGPWHQFYLDRNAHVHVVVEGYLLDAEPPALFDLVVSMREE